MLGSNGQEVPRTGEGRWAPELMQGTTTIDSPPPPHRVVLLPPPVWGLLGWEGGLRAAQGPSGEAGGGGGDPTAGQDHCCPQRAEEQQEATGALVGPRK